MLCSTNVTEWYDSCLYQKKKTFLPEKQKLRTNANWLKMCGNK